MQYLAGRARGNAGVGGGVAAAGGGDDEDGRPAGGRSFARLSDHGDSAPIEEQARFCQTMHAA